VDSVILSLNKNRINNRVLTVRRAVEGKIPGAKDLPTGAAPSAPAGGPSAGSAGLRPGQSALLAMQMLAQQAGGSYGDWPHGVSLGGGGGGALANSPSRMYAPAGPAQPGADSGPSMDRPAAGNSGPQPHPLANFPFLHSPENPRGFPQPGDAGHQGPSLADLFPMGMPHPMLQQQQQQQQHPRR
jgi:hypothetical protein